MQCLHFLHFLLLLEIYIVFNKYECLALKFQCEEVDVNILNFRYKLDQNRTSNTKNLLAQRNIDWVINQLINY